MRCAGRGSHRDRLRTVIDASRWLRPYTTSPIEASPGFGYVFEMDGGDGFLRYGAVRVTHVGQTFLILDWAFRPIRAIPSCWWHRSQSRAEPGNVPAQGLYRRRHPANFGRCPKQPVFWMASRSRSTDVVRVARDPGVRVALHPAARRALFESSGLVERAIASGQTIYGINTGFGKLANVRIAPRQARSASDQPHPQPRGRRRAPLPARSCARSCCSAPTCCSGPPAACGLSWSRRSSPCSTPAWCRVVPEQGSVGASGDLAPLSHIGLALMGEGQVLAPDGVAAPARTALGRAGLGPLPLRAQGRARLHQRHPGADGAAGAAGARRRRALADGGRRGGDEPGGAAGNADPAGSPDPRRPAPPRDRSRPRR